VVQAGDPAGPYLPLNAGRGGLGSARVAVDGQLGEVEIAALQRGERDAGVADDEFVVVVPPAPS
jgi:hypothetical protein